MLREEIYHILEDVLASVLVLQLWELLADVLLPRPAVKAIAHLSVIIVGISLGLLVKKDLLDIKLCGHSGYTIPK